MAELYKSQDRLQCLEIINYECGSAFTCKPGWSVKKRIKKCEKEEKDVCTTVFKGDTAKVPYIFKVDQQKNNNIDFVWPITIANVGSCKTEGLKVGVKVFLVLSDRYDDNDDASNSDDSDDNKGKKRSKKRDDDSDGKDKKRNKNHDDDSDSKDKKRNHKKRREIYLGTFDGFEKEHPCLRAPEEHRYLLVGSACPKDNINIKGAKLKLVAQVSICDGPHGKCSNPCAEICIEINPPCKPHNDSVVLVDRDIDFCQKVFKTDKITVNALFTPGENIECGKPFINKAKLYDVDKDDAKHESDCEWGDYKNSDSDDENCEKDTKKSCSHGDALIGKHTESKASLTIDCAKVVMKCNSINSCCVDDWCLRQNSCVDDNVIEYKIIAEKNKIRDAKVNLDVKVKIEGPIPKYDKEFKLELYACDEHGKPNKLIESTEFKFGCTAQSFSWDCKEVKLCKDSTGRFTFVLSYRKQIWDLDCCSAEYDKCDPVIISSKIDCNKGLNESTACIKNDLCVPEGIRYCIEDSGSFESNDRLKEFLKGCPIEVRNTREIKYSVKFKKTCDKGCHKPCCKDGKNRATITNTAKLTAKSKCHSNSIVNTVEDEIVFKDDDRKNHHKDRDDSSSEDCDDNIRVPHKKPNKRDYDDHFKPKTRDCDDDYYPKHKNSDDSGKNYCKPKKRDCDNDICRKPHKSHRRSSSSSCDDDSYSRRSRNHSLPFEEYGQLKFVPNYEEINKEQYSRVFNKTFGIKPSEGLALTRFRQ